LLIASGAVYGILTINTQIQAKPGTTTIPDYTNELDSLKSQINSMNTQIGSVSSRLDSMSNNLSALDTMKNSLTDVKAKLIDLEKSTNQASSSVQTTANSQLSAILDKSVYLQGDTIKIAAVGATPQTVVQVELIDSSGYIITNSQTYADSAGKVSYSIPIAISQISGNYQVKLVSGQQISSTPIIIQSSTGSTSSTTFTAQTDKTTYYTNDLVQVSGIAKPNTAVTGVFTSASGHTATSGTTTNGDGSYTIIFD
jgi:seryl-tRNA synthetase